MKIFLTAVLALAALVSGNIIKSSEVNFELLILHNNDMHARFEQASQISGGCTTANRDAGKCYGGFPRVAHLVNEARAAAEIGVGPPVLYLNAGDTYTGSSWSSIYEWKIAAELINAIKPDAVSLGNNEVSEESKVSPLLKKIHTPILATNVIVKAAEELSNVRRSIMFDFEGGIRVGVVGYLTPESGILDSAGNVEYIDEVLALTEEVEKLQAHNAKIIIALGHSTLAKDIEIAKKVPGLDMVISGNKNTFYWNGDTVPIKDDSLLVTQQSGRTVPVILSTAYNKYLGSVYIQFNADGEIVDYSKNRILLDSSIPQDTESLNLIKNYYSNVESRSGEVLGNTAVKLDAESCSAEECNFGNFVADAITFYYALSYEGETWTDAPIAIVHGGAFGDSIAPASRPAAVTTGDVLSALPLESNLVTVTMNGTVLKQVLEQSVSEYDQENPTGAFLQLSGIRVVYDLDKESGSRVVSAVVRGASSFSPEYSALNESLKDYRVVLPAALANGEYGYSMLVDLPRSELDYDEVTCTSEYIKLKTPVHPEVADRIVLRNVPEN